jgi:hypothetical protein
VVPLVGPAAAHLGIDLIWFGVLLGINMQTAFMHPPFGFSLFYLRSVAARSPYKDRVTGIMTAPVTTGQIYWGAVPFVGIQIVMIGLTIAFPGMVMRYQDATPPAAIEKQELGGPDFGTGTPSSGTTPAPENSAPAEPNFGTAPAPSGSEAPTDGPNFGSPPAAPSGGEEPAGPNFGTPSG